MGAAAISADRLPLGRVVAYLLGVAILAGSLTLLFLSMRAVLDIGGACASGGPYVPRVECPDAVVAATPLSIFAGIGGVFLMLWGGSALGSRWIGLIFLVWPALFLSLGWNFLQYGFFPPEGADGWVWSWIFCGVLFVLMGAVPLVGVIGMIHDERDGSRAFARGRVVVRPSPSPARTGAVAPVAEVADPASDRDLVDRLERLADLRRRGDITSEEFELAKARLLGTDGPAT
jgi:Short C-terminal domain